MLPDSLKHPEFRDSQMPPDRRSGDPCPVGSDIWRSLTAVEARVAVLERTQDAVKTSFPQNDLGAPDFDGHRKAHLEMIDTSKIMAGYRMSFTTKIVVGLATLVGSALWLGVLELVRRFK